MYVKIIAVFLCFENTAINVLWCEQDVQLTNRLSDQ